MSGAGPTGAGECPSYPYGFVSPNACRSGERWRPLSVPPAFAERYRMRSWFHFLPICLLLALFRPGSGRPDRTPGARRRRRLVSLYRLQGRPHPGHERGHRAGRLQGCGTRRSSSIPTLLPLHEAGPEGLIAGCFNTSPNPHILADYRLPRHPLFRAEIQLWARRDEARPVNAGAGAERTESRGDPRL